MNVKKTGKRLLSCILVVIMLAALGVTAFAADESNVKQYQGMCVIGDSTSSGYYINNLDYSTGSDTGWGWGWGWGGGPKAYYGVADNAYTGILRDIIGAEYYSMTGVGQRLVDALWVIGGYEDDYDLEEAHKYCNMGNGISGLYTAMIDRHDSGEGADCIRKSDLVIIMIGATDIFNFPKLLATENGELDLEVLTSSMADAYQKIIVRYPLLFERIYELNPYADVVVVSQFDPYSKFSYNEGDNLLGTLAETYINYFNTNLQTWCAQYGATYVDVTSLKNNYEGLTYNSDTFYQDWNRFENHPDEEGHKYIASRILAALPVNERKVSLPQSGILRLELNGEDMGDCILRSSDLGWTIRNMDGEYICYDSANQAVELRRDNPTVWGWSSGFTKIVSMKETRYTSLFRIPYTRTYSATVRLSAQSGYFTISTGSSSTSLYKAN